MLEGKSKEKLDNSNDFLSSKPQYSALNVYGAGYGMESYVYGNTDVRVAEGMKCDTVSTTSDIFNASGVSANFVYGGGQQGNVIGVTNVDVLNGHILIVLICTIQEIDARLLVFHLIIYRVSYLNLCRSPYIA